MSQKTVLKKILPTIIFSFLHITAYAALRALISLHAQELGAGPAGLGLIISVHNLVQLGFALIAGMLVDRWQVRKPAIWASIIFAISFIGVVKSPSWELLMVSLAITGLTHIQAQVAYQAHIAQVPQREYSFGLLTFSISAGQALGPPIAGAVADLWGMDSALWTASGIAVLAIGASWILPRFEPVGLRSSSSGRWHDILTDRPILRIVAVSSAVLFCLDVLVTYFPLYGKELGLSISAIGVVLSVRGLASMIVRPFMGILVDWLGRRRLLGTVIVLGGLSIAAIGIGHGFWGTVIMAFLLGATLGLAQPLTLVIVAEEAKESLRGQTLGFRLMGNRLSQTISPIVFGFIAATLGLSSIFWIAGGLLAASYYLIPGQSGMGSETPFNRA